MIQRLLKDGVLFLLLNLFRVCDFFKKSNRIVVLMYHSISRSGWSFSTTPDVFEKQIQYLRADGYKFLDTNDLEKIVLGDSNTTKKGVLITFDDGYRDFITEAMPILNKYNIPAVIFVHTNRSPEQLKNEIPLLSWPEIQQLSAKFEIGNHSHSHPNLKKMSPPELESEIKQSTQLMQETISKKPKVFAYPFGVFNQSVVDVLKNNDYKLGFTTDRGMVKVGTDPFRIKRFGIAKDTSFIEFRARLTPVSDWYEWMANLFKNNKNN
jgi:peptidoglycan/xylan/chitin deacetylase (PgdA/CDA1 family)